MIPKTIHYCWFGGKEKPPTFYKYLATWQQFLPDFAIKEWNESNFPISEYRYACEAYEMDEYVFVSDVARMHALFMEGGVYLDTDVELINNFDSYLGCESFIGREAEYIGTAVIGAEPSLPWINRFLDYYKCRHFLNLFGHPKRTANTKILTQKILPKVSDEDYPVVFEKGYLSCKDYRTGELTIRPGAAAIHHFNASWKRPKSFKSRVRTLLRGFAYRYFKTSASK